jgi:glycosyltransferase involved in cell wall biosynthesis
MVIPNGIGQFSYQAPSASRLETRKSLALPASATVAIAVGRMCPQKNFERALDGIATFRRRTPDSNLRVLFCGDGPDKERLKKKSTELQLDGTVEFLGSRTDIAALLGASDLFLSTSLFEGMPLAVLEALSAGLSCVLSSIDEHYEIARSMPGCVFVRSNSAEDVSQALESFIAKPLCPQSLVSARAPLLATFSIKACSDAYLALYGSVARAAL